MVIKFFDFCNKNIFFPLRIKYLTQRITPYLDGSNTILDLGSSNGKLASELLKKISSVSITGIDVHVQFKTYIPIVKYDGTKIPFPDNFFDIVMLVDVLHHDENHKNIMDEARRVSRKYILIKDHYFRNKIGFFILKWIDYFGNKPYGVSLPYNYLKIRQWHTLLDSIGSKIVKIEKFRFNFLDPCSHVIFFLDLNKN